jgi:hypothetical protein
LRGRGRGEHESFLIESVGIVGIVNERECKKNVIASSRYEEDREIVC